MRFIRINEEDIDKVLTLFLGYGHIEERDGKKFWVSKVIPIDKYWEHMITKAEDSMYDTAFEFAGYVRCDKEDIDN